jgi:hypothetical protein
MNRNLRNAIKKIRANAVRRKATLKLAENAPAKVDAARRSLIGAALIDGDLPGPIDALGAVGTSLKNLFPNPVKAIREGLERDKAAIKELYEKTGMTRKDAIRQLATTTYQGGVKDALIISGAGLGGKTGAGLYGIPGALAGGVAGARLSRKGLDDFELTVKVALEMQDPRIKRLSPDKQRMLAARKMWRGAREQLPSRRGT